MSFTEAQVEQLLRAIAPSRVMHSQGQSHVSQQDIRWLLGEQGGRTEVPR